MDTNEPMPRLNHPKPQALTCWPLPHFLPQFPGKVEPDLMCALGRIELCRKSAAQSRATPIHQLVKNEDARWGNSQLK